MSRTFQATLAALLGAAFVLALVLPEQLWTRLPDLCLFHRLTGRPCPSCGLTRSWSALLHGDLGAAFRFHRLGPPLLLALVLLAAAPLRRRPAPARGWVWGLGAVWSGYALLRMAGVLG